MGTGDLIGVFRDAIFTGMKVAGPILLTSMLVGLVISIVQAATSINEQTMTFVPKLIIRPDDGYSGRLDAAADDGSVLSDI